MVHTLNSALGRLRLQDGEFKASLNKSKVSASKRDKRQRACISHLPKPRSLISRIESINRPQDWVRMKNQWSSKSKNKLLRNKRILHSSQQLN